MHLTKHILSPLLLYPSLRISEEAQQLTNSNGTAQLVQQGMLYKRPDGGITKVRFELKLPKLPDGRQMFITPTQWNGKNHSTPVSSNEPFKLNNTPAAMKKEIMKNGDKLPLSARHCITIEAPIFGDELPNDDYEKVQLTPTKGVFNPDPDSDEGTP